MKALMESDKSTREWLINRVGARLGVPLKTGVTLAAASMLAAQLQLFYAGRGSCSRPVHCRHSEARACTL